MPSAKKSPCMARLTASCRRVLLKDMQKLKPYCAVAKVPRKKHKACEAQEKEKVGQRTSYNLHTGGGEQTHKHVKRHSSRTDQSTSRSSLTQTMSATGNKVKQIRSTARDKAAPRSAAGPRYNVLRVSWRSGGFYLSTQPLILL